MQTSKIFTLSVSVVLLFFASCSGGSNETSNDNVKNGSTEANAPKKEVVSDIGIGPITHVEIGDEIDEQLATKGKEVFETKCTACHQLDERYVGPALAGVTKKQKPEWIMNMILNPEEMTKKDPNAKELLGEYMTQMTFQDVSEEDARALLEYFRKYDAEH